MAESSTEQDSSNSEKQDSNNKPKNVPHQLWEKFKMLEKRTNAVTQRSTEKRIKHLKTELMETVTKKFTHPEDKDILNHHDVKFGPPVNENRGKKRKSSDISKETPTGNPEHVTEVLTMVKEIPDPVVDLSKPPPPTALERRLDEAIKTGDVSGAEALSDHLATREMGEKIARAFDAKEFLEKKKIEETAKSQKKKKLHWGFDHKQRWETKGNM